MVNCNVEYPFPVLRPTPIDYKVSTFNASITVTPEKDKYVFTTNIEVHNIDIKHLIEQGKAHIGVDIQCDSTWLRRINSVMMGKDSFLLNTSEVHNRVLFCPVITASQEISNFKSSDFAEEFSAVTLLIHPGDPLAIGETKYFDANYEDDILRKGDPIISVTTNPQAKDMSFDFENDSILVYVPEKSKAAYSSMAATPEKYPILSMLFYLPAVTEGIRLLQDNEDAYIDHAWAKTIKQSVLQIAGNDHEKYLELLNNPFQTAQKLLGGMDKAILDLESWSITVA